MGWRIVSQLLVRLQSRGEMPEALSATSHFYYGRRIVDIDDALPKRE
ncbi:hypothetical protein Maes01_01478 [Microbulbifer aestuariivivens]|uniref:Uncharacterized protein n=1 Tax=Microbulbifer aestuariivivens TaxID=1908308 RepID=A0ABP9WPF7_9GAMM